jgi:O-succinylbenzoic acid--CoA ligase
VVSWLERAAPDAIAVEAPDGALTYGELSARARAGASSLAGASRVAIASPAGLDFVVALHACLLAGAAAVPVDLREPSWRLAEADVVVDAPLNGGQRGGASPRPRAGMTAAAPLRLSAPALVVHTSGTTGTPRAVVLTLGNVVHNALGCAVALGHDRAERWLCPLPLSHVGGLMVLLRSAIYGTTAVLGPPDRDDVTIASLVPTQLGRLIDRSPPPSLRVVMLGGAPADPTLLARARDAGWPVAPTYGLTQACSAVTVAAVGDTETSGHPLPGVSVSIAPGGEIIVEGPTTTGRLETGDLGQLDERGRLRVLGRKVDTIVSGGENVMPSEVEAALLAHPAVAEAGVFGRPDPEWGEAVTAHVVLRAPVDPSEIRTFAAARLARFKVPKTIEPVSSLPRNPAGKLLRRELT